MVHRFRSTNLFYSLLLILATFPGIVLAQAYNFEAGLWTSSGEIANLSTSNTGWNAVLNAADRSTSNPDIANQDDNTNVYVLAAAIVYARTGQQSYRNKVVSAIEDIVSQGNPGGRTLAWGREIGAYALAADLIDYRTTSFENYLRNIAEVWEGSQLDVPLLGMFERRPNNWGTHGFGSLVAIYAYLQDSSQLDRVRSYFLQGVSGPNPGFRYGSDTSWHLAQNNLRLINPQGAVKQGYNIDGFLPDDMRRGSSFRSSNPVRTGYAWEALQGIVSGARILERVGKPIWNNSDRAILRAIRALQDSDRLNWRAEGDDRWQLPIIDAAYGTNYSSGVNVWGHGKNVGWAWVVAGDNISAPPPPPTPTPTPAPTPPPATPTPTPTPTPPPATTTPTRAVWNNIPIPEREGTFVVEFESTPHGDRIDSVTGLSFGNADRYSDLAAIVRFAPDGFIDVCSGDCRGGNYSANFDFPYSAGRTYRFSLEIDTNAKTYSVYLSLEEWTFTIPIATDFDFRDSQQDLERLNRLVLHDAPGSIHTVANIVTLDFRDQDSDGIADHRDNCPTVSNVNQGNFDQDSFGNACDGDFNNDGFVDGADVGIFVQCWSFGRVVTIFNSSPPGLPDDPYCLESDMNQDGLINGIDAYTFFLPQYYQGVPG